MHAVKVAHALLGLLLFALPIQATALSVQVQASGLSARSLPRPRRAAARSHRLRQSVHPSVTSHFAR